MSEKSSTLSRRSVLAGSAAISAFSLLAMHPSVASREGEAIRPFSIHIPEAELVDLRRRIVATRWPDRETVNDQSQGIPLAKLKPLVEHWGTGYDWRKAEAKINALPQFMTEIDGVDVHFIHVRSKHADALPLIMTHGWPGSVSSCSRLSTRSRIPRAWWTSGRRLHLVLPSLPGFGFSGRPAPAGTLSASRRHGPNDEAASATRAMLPKAGIGALP